MPKSAHFLKTRSLLNLVRARKYAEDRLRGQERAVSEAAKLAEKEITDFLNTKPLDERLKGVKGFPGLARIQACDIGSGGRRITIGAEVILKGSLNASEESRLFPIIRPLLRAHITSALKEISHPVTTLRKMRIWHHGPFGRLGNYEDSPNY